MQISRLFQIVYLLLEKRTVTAAALADRFEVSVRTIYRDIEALCQAGIPISAAQGKGGGYGLVDSFVLDRSLLTDTEQNEILLALQNLAAVRYPAADDILNKLGGLFNKNAAKWLEVDLTPWGSDARQKDVFELLRSAVMAGKSLSFTYYNTAGEKSGRRAVPMKLLYKDKAWYLKGYCLARSAVRTFKLTRMADIRITGETVPGELDGEMAEPEEGGAKIPPVALRLLISPAGAYKIYDDFDEGSILRREDGFFEVTAEMPGGEWLFGYLLSYGPLLEVLSPCDIREGLARRIFDMAKKYKTET